MSLPAVIFHKDPAAILDYSLDWSDWLAGDTLASSTWALPAGITGGTNVYAPGGLATVWLSTGIAGTTYDVTHTITTAGGRTDKRTMRIVVTNK